MTKKDKLRWISQYCIVPDYYWESSSSHTYYNDIIEANEVISKQENEIEKLERKIERLEKKIKQSNEKEKSKSKGSDNQV